LRRPVEPGLRTLVGVEDLGGTELGQRFLQRLDTKIRRQGVGEPEGEDFAAGDIEDGDQIQ
jgi:hypothetical protein